jgi:tRNA/tmRNA/rRNA uracil-C5-methylase (TrmA/RlmC/RlmD family)
VLLTLAAAFPRSRFTGFDGSAEVIAGATRSAHIRGLNNLVFRRADEGRAPEIEAFDAVISGGQLTWR